MSDKALVVVRFLIRAAIGVLVVAEVVLALGIVLQALGANPDAGFAEWAYRNQDRLMGPFEGIFDDSQIGDGDGVIDLSGLFALAVYACVFIPLGMALGWTQRAIVRSEQRWAQAAEDARRARMYGGGEPEVEPAPARSPGLGRRMAARFGRDGGSTPDS